MKKDRYIYPAIFDYAEDGISIEFPDLPGCLPCAHSDEEAVKNAQEAMALHLYNMELDKDDIPASTPVTQLRPEANQAIVLVEAWMPSFRDKMENKAIKKTLTIPKWLNDIAEEKQVNFSRVLQDALKNYLGIQ
ncbi:protein of unknown function UPF0150 [Desulfitobacterium hafniense DCB-2]|uniref:HicB-like antitoxin of toxin-antitoxin system domain-containing protein n=1 Tax=Desulfitobacterium hafniense (strain DSM 10664 / DCB-2) TaxID=272564 RepID=B8FNX8_DESHD|nr:type II toxin-antitoxin system HicB family antitoxin [Desulfitobacterium hafniense]ACL19503.1 protein of unknown function UPF0150 [Desulfitobacterium hafniense DCB-2]